MSAEMISDVTPDAETPDEVIAQGRTRIDELDAQIVALVQERIAVSRGIQQARIAAGGRGSSTAASCRSSTATRRRWGSRVRPSRSPSSSCAEASASAEVGA